MPEYKPCPDCIIGPPNRECPICSGSGAIGVQIQLQTPVIIPDELSPCFPLSADGILLSELDELAFIEDLTEWELDFIILCTERLAGRGVELSAKQRKTAQKIRRKYR